ncbi:hypothetical protein GCM10017783_16790 [Deinococcus piscis]|uniref:Uncharacterized protein n=1 Tax=Deinococcus piscis TaxID=394230 RepID=A0ABQ3K5T1_9DEIO|nr:hypothetical protein GCM10017783_16790 [Deinococcus piscis]
MAAEAAWLVPDLYFYLWCGKLWGQVQSQAVDARRHAAHAVPEAVLDGLPRLQLKHQRIRLTATRPRLWHGPNLFASLDVL